MLTPSGRFICGEDICLSASNYHPETWTPRWTVLSLVDALRLHMLTTANEIGGVTSSDEKRRDYAQSSRSWFLPGVADHRRMLEDGVFSIHDYDGDDLRTMESDELHGTETALVAKNENPDRKPTAKTDNSHSSDLLSYSELDVDAISAKPKKTKSQKRSQAGSKASKKKRPNLAADNVPDIVHNDTVSRSITKRFFVEMLKLPLRILSILLMILSIVESKLRSILDNI